MEGPGTARQSRRESTSRGSMLPSQFAALAAAARGEAPPDRPGTGRSSVMRRSARFSHSHGAGMHRGSRAGSVARGSIRYGRGGVGGMDSSGMPFERVLCIDADGRDRTPKPLVAARPQGAADVLPDTAGTGGTSEGPPGQGGTGGDGSSDHTSILSFPPLLNSSGMPTARSFGTSDAGEENREDSYDGGALPAGRSAGRRSIMAPASSGGTGSAATALSELVAAAAAAEQQHAGGRVSALAAAMLDVGRPEQALHAAPQQQQLSSAGHQHSRQRRQQLRNKSTQCPATKRASRGVQVLPWELHSADVVAHDEEADGVPLALQQGAAEAAEGEDDVEDEEALLAMSNSGAGGGGGGGVIGDESHRASPTPSNHAHSQSVSRRGSMAGSGRMSILHTGGEDGSQPSTSAGSRRTSFQIGADWSDRGSFSSSSRNSFAASFSHADGRASVSSFFHNFAGSGGVRTSIMAHRMGTAASTPSQATVMTHQPTAEELVAMAARKQKAEQERALARLPGLVKRLEAAEKAVLLNLQHANLARYHSVLYCSGAQLEGRTPQARANRVFAGGRQRRGPAPDPAMLSGIGSSVLLPARGMDSMAALAAAAAGQAAAAGASEGEYSPADTSRQQQPELQLLWTWQSELTGELPVSCIAFNRARPGLLAVGYGRLEYGVSSTGLVAVWSLANPTHPLWHAATTCGVSALDWSGKSAGCLAVGFFDGSIALYDVHSCNGKGPGKGSTGGGHKPMARAPPAGAAGNSTGGHAEPVWRLRYVPKSSDPGEEMLVSISSDGRLLEWKHAQGLERSELLRLKRQHSSARRLQSTKKEPQAGAEGYLGRAAGGTCFDFCPSDPRTYLVGTEDGGVHRCSTAFTEQYIQSYCGHLGSVYQVCWSPFSPSLFLTASADWSVRLWSEGQQRSLWTFQVPTHKAEAADVAFCPVAATVFAAAVGNTLQLWDVERSVLAPRATATQLGKRLSTLAFSQTAPVVVVGADDGTVSVYSFADILQGSMDGGPEGEQEQQQRQRLETALRHHTATAMSD